jgi:hypothetical protein
VFQRTCRGGLGSPTESVQRRKEVIDYCAEAAKVDLFASWDIGIVARAGGESAHGRPYRLRLERKWGVVDIQDCVEGARYLIEERNTDPARLMISGGSAGGYTTLRAVEAQSLRRAQPSRNGAAFPAGSAKARSFGVADGGCCLIALKLFARSTQEPPRAQFLWFDGDSEKREEVAIFPLTFDRFADMTVAARAGG